MSNSGTRIKPFLYARVEFECRSIGRLTWYKKRVVKDMVNIRGENDPYFVKVYELETIKIFWLSVRDREQEWKHEKL